MNSNWVVACSKASQPMTWLDRLLISLLVAGACLAVLGWAILDGTLAL
jgi:hypothetical protein